MDYMEFNEFKMKRRAIACNGCEKAMANGERNYETCGACNNWFASDVQFISFLLKSCAISEYGPMEMDVSLFKENYTQALGMLQELVEYLALLEKKGVTTIKEKYEIACDEEDEAIKKAEEEKQEEIDVANARILKRRRKAYEKNKNFFEMKREKLAAKERKEYTLKPKTVARIKREKRRAQRRAANKFTIEEIA